MSLSALKEYTFKSKYANWIQDKKRRENWNEAVDRFCDMFPEFYKDKDIGKYVERIRKSMKRKRVLGSQRGLQFGGGPILKKNARIFNCTSAYCDRPRFFQEAMYLLMTGCGVGFSVQKFHVSKLPTITKPCGKKTIVIEDSIEGWADAIGSIVCSYFTGYDNKIVKFDYSLIRPEGSRLSSCSGKAPGPEPLKAAIERIRTLLNTAIENGQEKLKPIQAYDIVMYSADAVLSGGIRRSACLTLFSLDDDEMMKAKVGDWFYSNSQRSRSNNSVALIKDNLKLEDLKKAIDNVKEFGEPGVVFVDNLEHNVNPCQPSWAKILTRNGIKTIADIDVGTEIWSKDGWVKVTKKWSTGQNEVYKYSTTFNTFYGTKSHKLVTSNDKIEAGLAEDIEILCGPYVKRNSVLPEYVMDGLVIGDGSVHKASNNLVHLFIGQDDSDYFNSEIKDLILLHRPGLSETAYEIKTKLIKYTDIPKVNIRRIPDTYLYRSLDRDILFSFLRGLYSANGSVCGNRITLKSSSRNMIDDTQLLLSSLGIRSYVTTNKPTTVTFDNGDYECKESYDLNISSDREKFIESIGFLQKYKNSKIEVKRHRAVIDYADINNVEFISVEETFDFTVDGHSHTYWTNGCNVSNCCEISMYCYDDEGNSGWEGCNLSTINVSKVKTKKDFYRACRDASYIGTLQSGFTNLEYLGPVSEKIFRRESLLGVSMTGIMESPDICLDPETQRIGAEIVKRANKRLAKVLGINQSARTTCCKPEGTTSCLLGTSSGIHPHHAKRYIRRVQANRTEDIYNHFRKFNPFACQPSVWSSNDTDDMIAFTVEVPDGAKLKNQMSAIDMLKAVQSTQLNWVTSGRNIELCTQKWLNHNVSNTITVRPNEWDEVVQFIYDNRKDFCGISLLPSSGDKDYNQAPFSEIFINRELITLYGDAALFASGLIVEAKRLFEDNLWLGCDAILGIVKTKGSAKLDFIDRAKKYAERYLSGDIKKLTYCLKDVDNLKYYTDLQREYKDVDYDSLTEEENNVRAEDTISCAGGACSI